MRPVSSAPAHDRNSDSAAHKAGSRHSKVVRLSSYSVATVLALLMTSATLPPLVADQSDRAVINAPITLLTAPIAGEMTQLLPTLAQRMRSGEDVAHIHNARIDRSTLIGLDGKIDELRTGLISAQKKIESDDAYVAALDAEIRRQVEQRIATLEGEIAEAKANVASADAESQSTKAVVDRQQALVDSRAASLDLLKPTAHKLESARFKKDAEAAKLSQKVGELSAIRKGIFVGGQSSNLAALSQKRRDLSYDSQRLTIEATQLAASLKTHVALADTERKRLDSLTDTTIRAPNGGVVLNLGVAQGRHVSPGDAVATLIDCDQAFAVGIFSYRQAQDLAVGTPVTISGNDSSVPRRGWVSEVLPKTSDKVDQLYAVPFPQTERREMYVLVGFDRSEAEPARSQPAVGRRTSPCAVGQWVTITRENGWVPSASVVWKSVASGLTGPTAQAAWTTAATGARIAARKTAEAVVQGTDAVQDSDAWRTVAAGASRAADTAMRGAAAFVAFTAPVQPADAIGRGYTARGDRDRVRERQAGNTP